MWCPPPLVVSGGYMYPVSPRFRRPWSPWWEVRGKATGKVHFIFILTVNFACNFAHEHAGSQPVTLTEYRRRCGMHPLILSLPPGSAPSQAPRSPIYRTVFLVLRFLCTKWKPVFVDDRFFNLSSKFHFTVALDAWLPVHIYVFAL